MPPFDDAMAARLLATYGAQATPENVLAAQQFFASNPEVAERRAMGLRGGMDDNSDVFRPNLEQYITKTGAQPYKDDGAAPTMPQPATSPQPQKARAVPAPAPSRQGNYGPAPDMLARMINDQSPPSTPQLQPQGNTGIGWDWLLALLGASAAGGRAAMGPNAPTGRAPQVYQGPEAEFVGRMPRGAESALQGQQGRIGGYTQMGQQRVEGPQAQIEGTQQRLPPQQQRVEDRTPRGNFESTGQEMETVRNRNASARAGRERQLQQEVDDENAQARRLQEQFAQRRRAQVNTRDVLKQAGKTYGRR